MLKKLGFFFLVSFGFALDVSVSLGVKDGEEYSILEVQDENKFLCQNVEETAQEKAHFLCKFEKIPIIRPTTTKNSFFIIQTLMQEKSFFLKVIPLKKAVLLPIIAPTLSQEKSFINTKNSRKKYVIVGFNKAVPFVAKQSNKGINFPVGIKSHSYPYIGALNINQTPINDTRNDDFIEYDAMQKLFESGDYALLISRINRKIEQKQTNKLFMPEILALKIKSLVKLPDKNREIIETAKPWTEAYTNHKDLPEIMLYLSKAYLDLGIVQEAVRLFDILIKEFPGNSYAELAQIYKAQKLQKEGKVFSAKNLYEKTLYSSDDVDVASLAAFALANYYLVSNDVKEASVFLEKIINSNPKFFQKDIDKSYKLAKELAEKKAFKTAGLLGKTLSSVMDTSMSSYKDILLSTARWLKDAKEYKLSLNFYETYQKYYSYLPNIKEVKEELDYLKFDTDLGNSKERLKLYDEILQEYPDKLIAQDALYKKMMLLYDENDLKALEENIQSFSELGSDKFTSIKEDTKKIARKLVKNFVLNKECQKTIFYIQKYNILLPYTFDDAIYSCAKKLGKTDMALAIAKNHIDKNAAAKSLAWQKKELDTLLNSASYYDYIIKAQRYINTKELLEKPQEKDVFVGLFRANLLTGNTQDLEAILRQSEQLFPDAFEILDMYKELISVNLRQKNTQKAGKLAINLLNKQRLLNIFTFSPFVEFTIIQAGEQNISQDIELLEYIPKDKIPKAEYEKVQKELSRLKANKP